MTNLYTNKVDQYQLLDSGLGQKLEVISGVTVVRPCPQAIWGPRLAKSEWDKATSISRRTKEGGGKWEHKKGEPKDLRFKWSELQYELRFTPFGHCGIFFEQVPVWETLHAQVKKYTKTIGRKPKCLNLFGYTGAASMAMALAGGEVFHVDSAKGVLTWGEKNHKLSGGNLSLKWVQEDALKFVEHSVRKGFQYDVILADPPSWGHGANKEVWNFDEQIHFFTKNLIKILNKDQSLLFLSSHTHGVQHEALKNILAESKFFSNLQAGELGVKHLNDERILPAGIYCMGEKI
jgi:23S rRNA (cytosine1962-C5)-methyltransferase